MKELYFVLAVVWCVTTVVLLWSIADSLAIIASPVL